MLDSGVTGRVFPSAVCAVSFGPPQAREEVVACAGQLAESGPSAEEDTLYDIDAITQSFVMTLALKMQSLGLLDIESSVEEHIPEISGKGFEVPTMLDAVFGMGHLPRWGALYLDMPHSPATPAARRWMLVEAARRGDAPHRDPAYFSDLAYLLVGEAMSRAGGEHLGTLMQNLLHAELEIPKQALNFHPPNQPRRRSLDSRKMAPTERCSWRNRIVLGEPLDPNAQVMGGVAGHAGMFSTAGALLRFGQAWLDASHGDTAFLPKKLVAQALSPYELTPRLLGWHGPEHPTSHLEGVLSKRAFGRDAVTGVSLWMDPERDLVVAFASNAICPTRANRRIEGFLPNFLKRVIRFIESS